MKLKSILPISASLLLAPAAAAQVTAFSESFSSGIPASFTTINRGGQPVAKSLFAPTVTPAEQWYWSGLKGIPDENFDYSEPDVLLDDGKPVGARLGLLSCSRRDGGKATDNWLITPRIEVLPGASLRWLAKSVHFDLREDYKVMISETDTAPGSFSEVYSVEGEEYLWKNRSLDLSPWVGKNIYIAFVHCSDNKFLLALDEVEAGVATAPVLKAVNKGTRYFASDDRPTVEALLYNSGAPAEISRFLLTDIKSGETLSEFDYSRSIGAGESQLVSIPLWLQTEEAFSYRLVAELSDGQKVQLFDDFVNRSAFRRKMFVQKYTGTWCNSCPRVNYFNNIIMERMGDDIAYAEVHHPGNGNYDSDGYLEYIRKFSSTVTGDYPAVWFNQRYQKESYRPKDFTSYYKAATMPCTAGIELEAFRADERHLGATAKVTFAENIDNSDDHIRVGFIVADNHVSPNEGSAEQEWQLPGIAAYYGEFHFMPSRVSKEFSYLHNVVRAGIDGPAGRPASLPAVIEAGKTYEVSFEFEHTPNIVSDNVMLIANIVDSSSRTLEVLNSDILRVEEPAGDFSLSCTYAPMDINGTLQLQTSEAAAAVWSSTHPEVATVSDSGRVKALQEGMTQISATLADGRKASCLIAVSNKLGVCSFPTDDSLSFSLQTDGSVLLSFPDCEFSAEAFAADGARVAAIAGKGTSARIDISAASGVVILNVCRDGVRASYKLVR